MEVVINLGTSDQRLLGRYVPDQHLAIEAPSSYDRGLLRMTSDTHQAALLVAPATWRVYSESLLECLIALTLSLTDVSRMISGVSGRNFGLKMFHMHRAAR